MPPTVAQTVPAFADAAAEASAGFGLGANASWRVEYEDRRVFLPPLPPAAQHFVEELFICKSVDRRALLQQLDDEWTRRVLVPAPPNVFEDWTWNKDFSPLCAKPVDADPIDFARPIVPLIGWLDDSFTALSARQGSLAAMVLLDDFVNAPTGSGALGPTPPGRSARFGFSISSFR
jgi:hypothetical protein